MPFTLLEIERDGGHFSCIWGRGDSFRDVKKHLYDHLLAVVFVGRAIVKTSVKRKTMVLKTVKSSADTESNDWLT